MFLHSHFQDDYKWAQQEKNRLKFLVRHMLFSQDVECETEDQVIDKSRILNMIIRHSQYKHLGNLAFEEFGRAESEDQ